MPSPRTLVAVAGTGTEVGKTWVAAATARALVGRGVRVSARKPAQSHAASEPPTNRDSSVLGAATGEHPDDVCLPHRSYDVPMAPPMAAATLGRPPIILAELVEELRWPAGVDVGLVETAGGVRSPIADDGDNAALIAALDPDVVLLVAAAGLGTINLVRMTAAALAGLPLLVVLNRYDGCDQLHQANRQWLADRDELAVVTSVDEIVRHLPGRGDG